MYFDNNSVVTDGPMMHPQLKNPLALAPIKKRTKVAKGKSRTNIK
jgi:hypothetical protein